MTRILAFGSRAARGCWRFVRQAGAVAALLVSAFALLAAWVCWPGSWPLWESLVGLAGARAEATRAEAAERLAAQQAAVQDAHAGSVSVPCQFCGSALVVPREMAEEAAAGNASGNWCTPACGDCVRRGALARVAVESQGHA